MFGKLSRRQLLAGAGVLSVMPKAFGRVTYGGKLSVRLPWSLSSVDPHRADDATAAILGPSLFDTLYIESEPGVVTPSLAENDPTVESGILRIPLREGLRTASGKALDGRDVLASIARMRKLSGRAWLAEVPAPTLEKGNIVFANKRSPFEAHHVAHYKKVFSSPLTAIVPVGFDADRPEGTGGFRLLRRGDAWVMARNRFAARGPAFLDEIVIAPAGSLAESLRSFEAGTDDLGWLGMGLHDARRGAKPFDAGIAAYAVLHTGKDAGAWDSPGSAQQICNSLPYARLSYLSLGGPWASAREEGWNGAPISVVHREDSAWLSDLAGAIAAILSRPGHEVVAKPLPELEFRSAKTTRNFALMVDVARPFNLTPLGMWAALGTLDDVETFARALPKPPRFATDASVRSLTRTFRVGVLGEVRIQGGRASDVSMPVAAPSGFDFASIEKSAR